MYYRWIWSEIRNLSIFKRCQRKAFTTVDEFWLTWSLLLGCDHNCPSLFRAISSYLVFRFSHKAPFPLKVVASSGEGNWNVHLICSVQLYFESANARPMCPDVPSCSFSHSLCSYYHSFSKRSLESHLSQVSFVPVINQWLCSSDFPVQLQILRFSLLFTYKVFWYITKKYIVDDWRELC